MKINQPKHFLIDNTLQISSASAALSYRWNSTTASNGTHTLKIKAYDSSNNVGNASIIVTVANSIAPSMPTPPPGSLPMPDMPGF